MPVQRFAHYLIRDRYSVNVSFVSQALFPGKRRSGRRHGILGGVTWGKAGARRFKPDVDVHALVVRDGLGPLARVLQLLIGARGWSQEEGGDRGFVVPLSDDGPCPGRWPGREGGSWVAAGWHVGLQGCDGDGGEVAGREVLMVVRQGGPLGAARPPPLHGAQHTSERRPLVHADPVLASLQLGTMAKMEVKTSLLDNMIGVGDMVLLDPLTEETFIHNLKKRFDHNEIYVSRHARPRVGSGLAFCGRELAPLPQTLPSLFPFFCLSESRGISFTLSQRSVFARWAHKEH